MKRKLSLLETYNKGCFDNFASYCHRELIMEIGTDTRTIYRNRNKKAKYQYAAVYREEGRVVRVAITTEKYKGDL